VELSKEMCQPSLETIVGDVERTVDTIGAKWVFVSSDRHFYIEELNERLRSRGVSVHHLPAPEDSTPYTSLAILESADHLIANCVSTFSAFVVRQREYHPSSNRSHSFFAVDTFKSSGVKSEL